VFVKIVPAYHIIRVTFMECLLVASPP